MTFTLDQEESDNRENVQPIVENVEPTVQNVDAIESAEEENVLIQEQLNEFLQVR